MAAQASFQNGINLLSDSKGALSWLMQGSTWKHGGKLPVGWFLTQWMQAEAATLSAECRDAVQLYGRGSG